MMKKKKKNGYKSAGFDLYVTFFIIPCFIVFKLIYNLNEREKRNLNRTIVSFFE